MKKVSIVIPTLQKNKELLNNLVCNLDRDDFVDEIIVIDNSCRGFEHNSAKLRVIIPKENIFVNPSWNLGVKEAKNEIIGLLNDDITISDDFCKNVSLKLEPDMGIVGMHRDFVHNTKEAVTTPETTDLTFVPATERCSYFGIAMFFYKTSYIEIPEDIKIFWGDDWLYYQNEKLKRKNYYIANQKIYHWGSLSSTDKVVNPYSKNDSKLYRKYTRKWWQYIFNIESVYCGFRLTIFGIEILHHFTKEH